LRRRRVRDGKLPLKLLLLPLLRLLVDRGGHAHHDPNNERNDAEDHLEGVVGLEQEVRHRWGCSLFVTSYWLLVRICPRVWRWPLASRCRPGRFGACSSP